MGLGITLGPIEYNQIMTVDHHGSSVLDDHYTTSVNGRGKHFIATMIESLNMIFVIVIPKMYIF